MASGHKIYYLWLPENDDAYNNYFAAPNYLLLQIPQYSTRHVSMNQT